MNWAGKVILVTGGTGSFGRKFIEVALSQLRPERIVVFSRDELKQHEMRQAGFDDPSLQYMIGDVRDRDRLTRAMHNVDIVVHAAALKQVPACENNPMEAVKTNILGTSNVIDAAFDAGVAKVMVLSTDKAVNPESLYGATKLVAEKLVVQSNALGTGATSCSCLRYGNVVGSRGSVIPVFLKQRESGMLTVTDERMTRFWLSLEQSVHAVIDCVQRMHGGEIFVAKAPSMRLMDLAQAIAPEAQIKIVGTRRGDKLHDLLVSEDESRYAIELDQIFVILPTDSVRCDFDWAMHGSTLPAGFRYGSDNNPEWLDRDGIERLLSEFRDGHAFANGGD